MQDIQDKPALRNLLEALMAIERSVLPSTYCMQGLLARVHSRSDSAVDRDTAKDITMLSWEIQSCVHNAIILSL